MKKIMIAPLSILLFGCATNTGAPFDQASIEPKNGMGTAVFYRPDQNFFVYGPGLTRIAIAVDGERVTGLGTETFSIVQMPAGKHQFNALSANIDTRENVIIYPGKVHYFRVYPVGFSYGTSILLKERQQEEAEAELAGYREQINNEPWAKKVISSVRSE
jgi:hypothetical protein